MIYNANGSTGTSFEGGTIEITKSFTLAGNFNSYNGNDATYAFTDTCAAHFPPVRYNSVTPVYTS